MAKDAAHTMAATDEETREKFTAVTLQVGLLQARMPRVPMYQATGP